MSGKTWLEAARQVGQALSGTALAIVDGSFRRWLAPTSPQHAQEHVPRLDAPDGGLHLSGRVDRDALANRMRLRAAHLALNRNDQVPLSRALGDDGLVSAW